MTEEERRKALEAVGPVSQADNDARDQHARDWSRLPAGDELEAARELLEELRNHEYNPFEPENQSPRYGKIVRALAAIRSERANVRELVEAASAGDVAVFEEDEVLFQIGDLSVPVPRDLEAPLIAYFNRVRAALAGLKDSNHE